MEWVETTGRTVEEAKEAALDQLGIDETEADFEIVEEAKTGLFGRVRADARVRARVAPRSPRAKQEGRPRKGRARGEEQSAAATSDAGEGGADQRPATASPSRRQQGSTRRPGGADRGRNGAHGGGSADQTKGNQMTDDVVLVDQQADIIETFLGGLVDALGAEGTINRTKVDDTTVELSVDGDDLGLLIGPKGQTLTAVHELSRTVLQRQATGRHDGRVRIDIGGYRQRRQEALTRFVNAQAEKVVAEGVQRALEPMNAPDRKVVHDAVNEIDGVSTLSEGVDPNRRVVIVPEGAEG